MLSGLAFTFIGLVCLRRSGLATLLGKGRLHQKFGAVVAVQARMKRGRQRRNEMMVSLVLLRKVEE